MYSLKKPNSSDDARYFRRMWYFTLRSLIVYLCAFVFFQTFLHKLFPVDKIDKEFRRNDGASRREKIAAIKNIVRAMPLSKEDANDLTNTIKESNWLNVGAKKSHHVGRKTTGKRTE